MSLVSLSMEDFLHCNEHLMIIKGYALCRRPLDTGGSCLWETERPTDAGAGAQSCFVACFLCCLIATDHLKCMHKQRKFRSQTSHKRGTDGKAEMGGVREEQRRSKKIREEKVSEERRCRWRKGRKVAMHCVWTMICGPESSVWHSGLPAAGLIRPSLLWRCDIAVWRSAKASKWAASSAGRRPNGRLEGRQANARFEVRQFRKQRLALWAAGHGPDPSFTAMVPWRCHIAVWRSRKASKWAASSVGRRLEGRQANGRFEASF